MMIENLFDSGGLPSATFMAWTGPRQLGSDLGGERSPVFQRVPNKPVRDRVKGLDMGLCAEAGEGSNSFH